MRAWTCQREHHPKPGFDEVGIFVTQEIMVEVCRWMGATFDTALDAVSSPRGIVHGDCGAMVTKSLQVGAGLVWNGMDVVG